MAGKAGEPFKPTESDIQTIERLAGYGLTMEQIAAVFDRTSKTFQRLKDKDPEFAAAIDRGVRKANDAVAQTAYQMAISGKVPAMTMFWLKCRARWKEVTHHEHSGTLTLEQLVAGGYEQAKKQTDDPG